MNQVETNGSAGSIGTRHGYSSPAVHMCVTIVTITDMYGIVSIALYAYYILMFLAFFIFWGEGNNNYTIPSIFLLVLCAK